VHFAYSELFFHTLTEEPPVEPAPWKPCETFFQISEWSIKSALGRLLHDPRVGLNMMPIGHSYNNYLSRSFAAVESFKSREEIGASPSLFRHLYEEMMDGRIIFRTPKGWLGRGGLKQQFCLRGMGINGGICTGWVCPCA
jgi:hypothetical protein